ncbi:MAG: HEAT repeat domain-containing protein [Candidatus Wallbacteria bacterium]|nr:HEAT repeat domain-containing protein [Candidatus Wallbacteria bacterium]
MNFKSCIELLGEKDDQIRLFSAKKLLSLGKVTKEEIIETTHFLSDASPDVRLNLIMFLKKHPLPEICHTLLSRLESEENSRVLSALYKLLPLCCGSSAFPSLQNGLRESDPRVRANVIEALEYYPLEKTRLLFAPLSTDPDNRISSAALGALVRSGDALAVTRITERFADSTAASEKAALLFQMGLSRNQFFEPLIRDALSHQDPGVRKIAVKALTGYPGAATTKAIMTHFNTEKCCPVLYAAIEALSVEPDQVVDLWTREISTTGDPVTRANIGRALATIKSKHSLNLLLGLLNDRDPRVRANALESLEKYRGTNYLVNIVLPFLKDDHPRVKAAAASVLWKMGIINALQTLKNMLKETSVAVQKSAAFALSSLSIF